MELATDSLPLVIILDGIAKVGDMCGRNLLQIVSNKLPSYVKVIVSIDEQYMQVRDGLLNLLQVKSLQILLCDEGG